VTDITEKPFFPAPPEPLIRPVKPGAPFPTECLPPILQDGVRGIVARTQCPEGLAANSVLAAASLVSQPHADVPGLGGSQLPCSLFILTVARSGERKSSADALAMKPIKAWERDKVAACREADEMHRNELAAYEEAVKAAKADAKKSAKASGNGTREELEAALKGIGTPPKTPIRPNLICDEPTLEGLWLLQSEGMGTVGVFSAEGGAFVGGHAMSADNRLKSAALLSQFWDGEPARRVRVSGIAAPLYGRRLSMHLMGQPEAMASFVNDPVLRDQGLLGRFLWAFPESTMGTRFQKEVDANEHAALIRFQTCLSDCLSIPISREPDDDRACRPWPLVFEAGAEAVARDFADRVEARLANGAEYSSVTGPAAKLAEQALRLAGVFTFVTNPKAGTISKDTITRACRLAEWYGQEALRFFNSGAGSPEIMDAEALRVWLLSQPRGDVLQSYMLTHGPNRLRDAKALKTTLKTLEGAGWVFQTQGPRPAAWRVWREETG